MHFKGGVHPKTHLFATRHCVNGLPVINISILDHLIPIYGTVARWLALSPLSKRVLGSVCWWRGPFSLCMFSSQCPRPNALMGIWYWLLIWLAHLREEWLKRRTKFHVHHEFMTNKVYSILTMSLYCLCHVIQLTQSGDVNAVFCSKYPL